MKRIDLGTDWICIRRRIAGLETRVNVPTGSYRGVSLRSGNGSGVVEIVLLHMDPGLEILLSRTADDSDIIALWRNYARMLALPLLVEDRDGRLQTVEDAAGTGPFSRRSGSPLKNRRPRFLALRRVGALGKQPVHSGEIEIFARA